MYLSPRMNTANKRTRSNIWKKTYEVIRRWLKKLEITPASFHEQENERESLVRGTKISVESKPSCLTRLRRPSVKTTSQTTKGEHQGKKRNTSNIAHLVSTQSRIKQILHSAGRHSEATKIWVDSKKGGLMLLVETRKRSNFQITIEHQVG